MLERLRNQIGTAGLVVAIVALVAALGGGAYAATSNSGKATASAKGKQGKQGKPGKTGPAGPAGPAGAPGPAGPVGPAGASGAPGASVTSGAEPKGKNCAEGGSKFVAGSTTTYACNGEEGEVGKEGSPWTAGGTLPEKATETGEWGTFGGVVGTINFPISFAIPLASAPEAIFLEAGESSKPGCPGVSGGIPQADPGKLCVYTFAEEEVTTLGIFHASLSEGTFAAGASQTGALIRSECEVSFCYQGGAWAVTAD